MDDLPADPFDLFERWFAEARESEPRDPNALQLATADVAGRPTVRTVLLKEWDRDGLVFYTNLRSEKATALAANPVAEMLFYWKTRMRQVRARGPIEAVSDAQADAYFATRPRESRLSAWASRQSMPMARADYLGELDVMRARFPNDVPRPPFWSGLRLVPERFEFWEEREFRQHERWTYARDGSAWRAGWLYP